MEFREILKCKANTSIKLGIIISYTPILTDIPHFKLKVNTIAVI